MARDVAEGYVTITERSLKTLSAGEMNELAHEMDRHLRELRAEPVVTQESAVIQGRNRKIQRLNTALVVVRGFRQKLRR
jgi:hypothetical protein